MVSITNYFLRQNAEGKDFISLELTGEVEAIDKEESLKKESHTLYQQKQAATSKIPPESKRIRTQPFFPNFVSKKGMAKILNFEEFANNIYSKKVLNEVVRAQELAGIRESKYIGRYAIEISFSYEVGNHLFEHKVYTTFKKTKNRYTHHPENPSIPVKAHYHVFPPNSKSEIYAVNMDGTAHHKVNRGYQIPSKEADELRSLGVLIPSNNIIESIQVLVDTDQRLLLESINHDTTHSMYLLIDSE